MKTYKYYQNIGVSKYQYWKHIVSELKRVKSKPLYEFYCMFCDKLESKCKCYEKQ